MAPQTDIPLESSGTPSNTTYIADAVTYDISSPGCAKTLMKYCHRQGREYPGDNWYRLWCVQLIPQIWTNWRTKKTDGLPAIMMFLWAICGVPFGAYNVVQNFNLPLQIQPHCFMGFCLISWAQILRYHNKWPAWKASLIAVVVACVFAGIEVALILSLRPLYERGSDAGILVVGIIADILLAAGLLPPYGEIWKRRGRVVGINWIFLSMDWFGAFFSLMAIVAQHTFDVLGGVLYITCCVLEIGIFLSHLIWLIRTRHIRKEADTQGKTFDDIAAEHEANGTTFPFAERTRKTKETKPANDDSEMGGTTSSTLGRNMEEPLSEKPKCEG